MTTALIQEPVRVMIAVARVRRMRRTGDDGWSPRACAQHGLRSAMSHIEQISTWLPGGPHRSGV
jgi:hypothetical protein